MSNPYERQIRLREIGPAGQRELGNATVTIPHGPAGEVAREYLSRSGIGEIVTGAGNDAAGFPHGDHFTSEECRQFAMGAWLATSSIVEILRL